MENKRPLGAALPFPEGATAAMLRCGHAQQGPGSMCGGEGGAGPTVYPRAPTTYAPLSVWESLHIKVLGKVVPVQQGCGNGGNRPVG